MGTNFSEILIEILTFSFKKMHLSSAKTAVILSGGGDELSRLMGAYIDHAYRILPRNFEISKNVPLPDMGAVVW